jgi:hypothetical protein
MQGYTYGQGDVATMGLELLTLIWDQHNGSLQLQQAAPCLRMRQEARIGISQ